MNVIVFASRKGGSGKSTLTAHLAAHANRPSRRCSTDRLRSARVDQPVANCAVRPSRNCATAPAADQGSGRAGDRRREWAFVDTARTCPRGDRCDQRGDAGGGAGAACGIRSRGGEGNDRFRASRRSRSRWSSMRCRRGWHTGSPLSARCARSSPGSACRCGRGRSPIARSTRCRSNTARARVNTTRTLAAAEVSSLWNAIRAFGEGDPAPMRAPRCRVAA